MIPIKDLDNGKALKHKVGKLFVIQLRSFIYMRKYPENEGEK